MKNRILALVVAVVIFVTATPITVFAAGDASDDPYTDTGDRVNFPSYPEPGSVKGEKTARWVDEAEGVAEITFTLHSVPKVEGTDVVLILDTSGSMGNGGSSEHSPCLDPDHYEYFTFYQDDMDYYVRLEGQSDYQKVESTVRLDISVHYKTETRYDIVGYTVDPGSFVTDVAGTAVAAYSTNGTPDTEFDPQDPLDETANVNDREIMQRWLTGSRSKMPRTGFQKMSQTKNGRSVVIPDFSEFRSLGRVNSGIYDESYGCFFRLDVSKAAARAFADIVFQPTTYYDGETTHELASDNRVSLITFASDAVAADNGRFYTSGGQDQAALVGEIDGMEALGETSYVKPLDLAREILDARDDKTRTAHVVFMSDGVPNAPDETEEKIDASVLSLSDEVEDGGIYSVGINLEGEEALRQIRKVVKAPGYNKNVADDASSLVDVFEEIARQLAAGAKSLTLTDSIGEAFNLLPNSSAYPWKLTVNGKEVAVDSAVTAGDNKLVWKMDRFPSNAVLTFYIKIKDGLEPGEYFTNNGADILYENYLDNWCRQDFDDPSLTYAPGKIDPEHMDVTLEHYMLYQDGTLELIDRESKSVVPDVETDMSSWPKAGKTVSEIAVEEPDTGDTQAVQQAEDKNNTDEEEASEEQPEEAANSDAGEEQNETGFSIQDEEEEEVTPEDTSGDSGEPSKDEDEEVPDGGKQERPSSRDEGTDVPDSDKVTTAREDTEAEGKLYQAMTPHLSVEYVDGDSSETGDNGTGDEPKEDAGTGSGSEENDTAKDNDSEASPNEGAPKEDGQEGEAGADQNADAGTDEDPDPDKTQEEPRDTAKQGSGAEPEQEEATDGQETVEKTAAVASAAAVDKNAPVYTFKAGGTYTVKITYIDDGQTDPDPGPDPNPGPGPDGGGSGGSSGGGGTSIPDRDPPTSVLAAMANIDDEEIPLGDAPLGALPQTGGRMTPVASGAQLLAACLGMAFLRKKRPQK